MFGRCTEGSDILLTILNRMDPPSEESQSLSEKKSYWQREFATEARRTHRENSLSAQQHAGWGVNSPSAPTPRVHSVPPVHHTKHAAATCCPPQHSTHIFAPKRLAPAVLEEEGRRSTIYSEGASSVRLLALSMLRGARNRSLSSPFSTSAGRRATRANGGAGRS